MALRRMQHTDAHGSLVVLDMAAKNGIQVKVVSLLSLQYASKNVQLLFWYYYLSFKIKRIDSFHIDNRPFFTNSVDGCIDSVRCRHTWVYQTEFVGLLEDNSCAICFTVDTVNAGVYLAKVCKYVLRHQVETNLCCQTKWIAFHLLLSTFFSLLRCILRRRRRSASPPMKIHMDNAITLEWVWLYLDRWYRLGAITLRRMQR